jgi:hypothetical protein
VKARTPTILGAVVAMFAAAAAAAVLISPQRGGADEAARSREFQSLVGGLGLGPATTLEACEPDFDPRVGAVCGRSTDPVPGGAAFCAHRAGPGRGR